MFNPGEGRCLPGPMQQNLCLAVDTCIKNIVKTFVWQLILPLVLRILLLVISTWFQVVPLMFNPGEGRWCLPGPLQQNFCHVIDTSIKNSVIGHFNLVLGVVPLMFNPGEGRCLPGPEQQNCRLVIDIGIKNSVIGHFNLV